MLTKSNITGNRNTSWIPDFGASFHVFAKPQNIKQHSHFDGLDEIFIGNNEGLSIFYVGFSSFVSPHDSHITFKLHNLLHVPSITKNVLSVSQFATNNFLFYQFHLDVCCIKSQGTNKVLLQGFVGADGLYSFHNLNFQDNSFVLLSSSKSFSGSATHSSL